jgi:myo-inositol-1-phosphate synthase
MPKIKIAVAGVGNCASSLIQGIEYYKSHPTSQTLGLLFEDIGGYRATDVEVVAAFDIDARKVGKDLSEAIFAAPNNTEKLSAVPKLGVKVQMGPVMDGAPEHLRAFVDVAGADPVDVGKVLKQAGADVLINLIPTGSAEASRYYARQAIEGAKTAFINGIPELIVSDNEFEKLAVNNGVPLIGDDFKSQMGATILNRALLELCVRRGVRIDRVYQLNYAGNTDFVNLVFRGQSKHVTKETALKSLVPYETDITSGFAYVANQKDRKIARIEIEGRKWGGAPLTISTELSVNDSADAAGVMIDMIRCAKVGLDRRVSGRLLSACAYYAKHPPIPYADEEAFAMLKEFIAGEREK